MASNDYRLNLFKDYDFIDFIQPGIWTNNNPKISDTNKQKITNTLRNFLSVYDLPDEERYFTNSNDQTFQANMRSFETDLIQINRWVTWSADFFTKYRKIAPSKVNNAKFNRTVCSQTHYVFLFRFVPVICIE